MTELTYDNWTKAAKFCSSAVFQILSETMPDAMSGAEVCCQFDYLDDGFYYGLWLPKKPKAELNPSPFADASTKTLPSVSITYFDALDYRELDRFVNEELTKELRRRPPDELVVIFQILQQGGRSANRLEKETLSDLLKQWFQMRASLVAAGLIKEIKLRRPD